MSGEVRKALLEKLLDKPVTYSDVRCHGLSEEEIGYLFEEDYVTRKEFVHMYRRQRPHVKKKCAFNQWMRERRKLARSINKEEIDVTLFMCRKMGMNVERVIEGYKHHLPVHKYFASPRLYVMEFLAGVRDDLYVISMTMKEAACVLGVTTRYLRLIMRQGKITTENGRISTYALGNFLNKKIKRDCELLMKIAPERLQNLLETMKNETHIS